MQINGVNMANVFNSERCYLLAMPMASEAIANK
jgi:hypothetical protein